MKRRATRALGTAAVTWALAVVILLVGTALARRPRGEEPKALRMHVLAEVAPESNGVVHVVVPGELLHSGDLFWLRIELNRSGFVHLFWDSLGCGLQDRPEGMKPLTESGGVFLRPGGFNRVPDGELRLTPPAGNEDLYVVASETSVSADVARAAALRARPQRCSAASPRPRRPACGPGVSAFDCVDPGLPGEYGRYRDLAVNQLTSSTNVARLVVTRLVLRHS